MLEGTSSVPDRHPALELAHEEDQRHAHERDDADKPEIVKKHHQQRLSLYFQVYELPCLCLRSHRIYS